MDKETLQDLFYYKDGFLLSKYKRGRCRVDQPLGSINKVGYTVCTINYTRYLVHRLIYLYHYGISPEEIDNINGNKSDNRVENLRAAVKSTNNLNRGLYSNNRTGVKGLYYEESSCRYSATIIINGKQHRKYFKGLKGDTDTLKEATNWIHKKREELCGEFINHG